MTSNVLVMSGENRGLDKSKNGDNARYLSELVGIMASFPSSPAMNDVPYSRDPMKRLMAAFNPFTTYDSLYYLLKDGSDERVRFAAARTIELLEKGISVSIVERLDEAYRRYEFRDIRKLLTKLKEEMLRQDRANETHVMSLLRGSF